MTEKNYKEIDLGEGCLIKIKRLESGENEYCINCGGEEKFKFTYSGNGTKVSGVSKNVESFGSIVRDVKGYDNKLKETLDDYERLSPLGKISVSDRIRKVRKPNDGEL